MNAMEKKIKENAIKRQSKLTKEEKKDIEALAKKLTSSITPEVKKSAQKAVGGKARSSKKNVETPSPVSKSEVSANNSAKSAKKADPKPATTTATGDILTTREVAAMVGTTPKALRRVLRAKWYNDGVTTNYRWTKNDPILKEIIQHYAGTAK